MKDIIDVAGAPVTCGSLVTGDRLAPDDATVVARLRDVGAIPVLMVGSSEFACGKAENIRHGVVRNPWDPERWTGGSSTGSAAVVAARYVPLALGTDTGGSVRIPSALCGVTGIKPTYGLVSRTGVASLSWTLDHVGAIARSAADLRLVLPHMVAGNEMDPAAPLADTAAAVRRALVDRAQEAFPERAVKVGVPTEWFTDKCHPGVLSAWEGTVAALGGMGAEVTFVDLAGVEERDDDFTLLVISELASNHEGRLDSFELYDVRVQNFIASGHVPSALDYLRALRHRTVAMRTALAAFQDIDVLVTPGVGTPAPHVSDTVVSFGGDEYPLPEFLSRNTAAFNLLGLPAVMIPGGLVDGLPVGVQIVGPPWADAACLAVAEILQSASDHHLLRPAR